ncbi:glycosyltransferase family 4 protein [Planktomarina temperata]|nr:glycosyltransferase family 4 protein [Planktomarina temperata]
MEEKRNHMNILVITNMWPDSKNAHLGSFVKATVKQLEQYGCSVSYISLDRNYKNSLGKIFSYHIFWLKIIRKLIIEQPKNVIVHFPVSAAPAIFFIVLLKKLGISSCNLISNYHGNDLVPFDYESRLSMITKRCFNNVVISFCDKIVVPSNYFKKILLSEFEQSENKVVVDYSGGVDLDLFKPSSDNAASGPTDQLRSRLKLLFVGRIVEKKGLFRALKSIVDAGLASQVELTIIGDGPDKERVVTLLDNAELQYTCFGFIDRSELPKYYCAADFLLFPTLYLESLGLTPLEALACGTPVIARDRGAVSEYIQHGINGFHFDNDADLAYIIKEVIAMTTQSKLEMRDACTKSVRLFSKNHSINVLTSIIKR